MISNIKKYLCNSCFNKAAFQDGTPACAMHKCQINPETDFCSWHISNADSIICPICNQAKRQKEFYIYTFNDKYAIICKDCAPHMNSCTTCLNKNNCSLANDHSAPQVIPKVVQQGMMTMQIEIKNPKLVVKHCQKCKCSDGADPTIRDIICFKDENGTLCSNWQILPQLLQ